MKPNLLALVAFSCAAISLALHVQAQPATTFAPYAVTISVDASNPTGRLTPIWRWEGYDEPNYTYMPNGRKLINEFSEAGAAQGPAYFRAHYLLCTGDGVGRPKWGSTNVYTEDAAGKPVYDWSLLDKVFDTYMQAGAKPYAQIGMMPKALSSHPDPYEPTWTVKGGNLFTGWAYPPNDYNKWRELVYQWGKHCLDRYGQKEVESWYWEVWNEANIGYWKGTPEEFQKTYDYAADGLRKAIPNARVGGAETAGAGGNFQNSFIDHCLNGTNFATGKTGSPLDSISFHAKGAPTFVRQGEPHVRMGIANQLRDINNGFQIVASRPQTIGLPIVIGESDPDGCAGCPATGSLNPQYGYRHGPLFAVYTIEQLTRTLDLAARHQVNLLGSVTWAFEFEDQPIFGGFRALATDGIDLAVFNVYRMLGKMGSRRLAVNSSGDVGLDTILRGGVRGNNPDVSALAARDDKRVTIIAWNYHDDDLPGPAADISLNVAGLPADLAKATLTEWRIDETHSNAHAQWKSLGSPAKLDAQQRKQMEAASRLAVIRDAAELPLTRGSAELKLDLPRQGVSLIEIKW
jgi:xylan 1,4-beta-xylosidase